MFHFLTTLLISQTPENINQAVEPTQDMILQFAGMLAKAVADKNYFLVSGIGLMIVVFVFKKWVLPLISNDEKYKDYVPIVTFCLSLIAGIATWILNPKLDLVQILITCVGSTMVASGSWETLFKPFKKLIQSRMAAMAPQSGNAAATPTPQVVTAADLMKK